MKIILAQLNNTVGDIEGNASKAIDVLEKAQESDVDLVVFSELFLSGYPPEDLVLKNSFIERCKETFNKIVDFNRNQKLGFIMGLPIIDGLKLYNAAALVDAERGVAAPVGVEIEFAVRLASIVTSPVILPPSNKNFDAVTSPSVVK